MVSDVLYIYKYLCVCVCVCVCVIKYHKVQHAFTGVKTNVHI